MVEILLEHTQKTLASGFRLGPMSLQLPAGRRTALIGPSGCGKTTLLRLLAGLEKADAGRILFDGVVATDGNKLPVAAAARGIGFVFQDGALWPHLDAVAHLRFCDPKLSPAEAAVALGRVGLAGKERRRPQELSGGEQQRLALARALVGTPRVLLLDEPLHSVDVHQRDELAILIRSLAAARGVSLIVVTHDRREALSLADHLVVLRDGGVVEQGPAERLLLQPNTAFTAAFLGGAACLPAEPASSGIVNTLFGPMRVPAGGGPVQLVLLPGDAIVSADGPAQGRVLQVVPQVWGAIATVDLGGQTLLVPAGAGTRPGDAVNLELREPPRLLPLDPVAGGR